VKYILFFLSVVSGFLVAIFITRYLFVRSNIPVKITPTVSPTIYVRKPLSLTGWIAYWDEKNALASLSLALPLFDIFSQMLYTVGVDGSLRKIPISSRGEMLRLARVAQIPIIPTIGDDSNPQRIAKLLTDEETQEKFTSSLLDEALKENYQGWSLDIEVVAGKDEESFSNFVTSLAEALHAQNLELHVIVYGREENESYDPARAHNYAKIGKVADRVFLMTYNYHNELTGPGGQTPLDWYRRVLAYAIQTIPRDKIAVGLSTHGYEWYGDNIVGLTYPEVINRLPEIETEPEYDLDNSAMVLRFDTNGESHELWYEDAQTITKKIKIASNEFGISNFALWRLGAEDPQIWEELRKIK